MGEMTEVDQAFYRWFHENMRDRSSILEDLRAAFKAGWNYHE